MKARLIAIPVSAFVRTGVHPRSIVTENIEASAVALNGDAPDLVRQSVDSDGVLVARAPLGIRARAKAPR
jgi:hypothetical protein